MIDLVFNVLGSNYELLKIIHCRFEPEMILNIVACIDLLLLILWHIFEMFPSFKYLEHVLSTFLLKYIPQYGKFLNFTNPQVHNRLQCFPSLLLCHILVLLFAICSNISIVLQFIEYASLLILDCLLNTLSLSILPLPFSFQYLIVLLHDLILDLYNWEVC